MFYNDFFNFVRTLFLCVRHTPPHMHTPHTTSRVRAQVVVADVQNESAASEELEFGHRVSDLCLGYGQLVVVTTQTCYVYSVTNLSTPHVFDLKGTVSLILMAEKYFLLADSVRGIQIYNYEGRSICNPRLPNLHPQVCAGSDVNTP